MMKSRFASMMKWSDSSFNFCEFQIPTISVPQGGEQEEKK